MDTVKKYLKYILCFMLLFTSVFTYFKVEAASDVILSFSDSDIRETVSGSGYNINGTSLEITKAGTYRIKGSCNDGNIEVKKGVKGVTLILDDLYLASTTTAPIAIKKDGAEVEIKVIGSTTLVDNEDPANEFSADPDIADNFEGAAIKVKNDSSLTLSGSGSLRIDGNTKNGIKGGKNSSIIINSGVIDIEASNTGLACDNIININNGFINIDAGNEGIKLEPDEGDTTSLAKLSINGGKLTIDAAQDGIQAMGNIEVRGWPIITIDSGEDAIQTRANFTMTNGTLDIHTYEGFNPTSFDKDTMSAKGIKAAVSDYTVEEANNTINISGGTITIDSSDDAIHSDGYIYITKGTINIKSGDDGIHSDTLLQIGTENGLERDPEIYVNDAIEGIESGNIYVYSGKIKVVAIDDGINAAGGASSGSTKSHGEHFNPDTGLMEDNFALYVYGGNIYVNSEGDGLDANGSIYLYGGTHIIYHQDAQGNNSALDRDANLVIDGATVFSAGGVADNGHVDSTGSAQQIVVDTTDYAANSNIAVSDGGNAVFNDKITKRSTYTFFSSPSLTNNASISSVAQLEDLTTNPWGHDFDDGVITTPATEENPGVMTYACEHGAITERKTYFYKGEVEFSVINTTNEVALVTIGDTSSTTNFNTSNVGEYVYINSNKTVELIGTYDGVTYEELTGTPTENANEFVYHVDPTAAKTFYVVLDGDVNMDGLVDAQDSTLIALSLTSTTYTNPDTGSSHYDLSEIQKIIADVNDDGLTNSHDGLEIIKDLPGDDVYDESYFAITSIEPVVLDGENDGEATVSFYTKKSIYIDAMDGRYSPSVENPSSNGFLELIDIQGAKADDVEFSLIDVTNGFAGALDTNGLEIPEDTVLVTLKYKVNKDTPTGTYPVKLRIDSITAHDSHLDTSFELTADVIVKGTSDPITAFFSKDDGVESIDTYYTQDYAQPSEENVSSTFARNSDTGEIIGTTGEGQVNFTVNLKDGYIISDITVTPTANFKNLKGPADTGKTNTYRVTKITGDVEINITTKQATEYTATFIKDKNINSIDLYYTQDYTQPDELGVVTAYARDGSTGATLINGDGQINFKVNPKLGYRVDEITISGSYKNLKEQGNRIYRVTKVSSDLVISVKSTKITFVTPTVSGVEESYTYTSKNINPVPVLTIPGENDSVITLVEGTDYTVTYGNNKNVGTDAGTITINSKESSDYSFDTINLTFDITPYTLNSSNVTAPSSIVYTGSTLTPDVVVSAYGKTLVEGTDYDITFTNQDGDIGDTITATVVGKGNYEGTVNNINVTISDKAPQIIRFDIEEITKVYGEDFTVAATIVEGDGTIRYTSNNTQAAVIDENTGEITLIGTGQATIRAFASETSNYAGAVTSFKLIVKKAPLIISNVIVEDKQYDGTSDINVVDVTLEGLVNSDTLTYGTDYTVNASFEDSNVGNDKTVSVDVELSTEIIKKYSLDNNTYLTTANIYPVGIEASSITLGEDTYTYDGTAKTPSTTVVVSGETLVENVDYKVSYIDNVDAGEAYAVVVGIGNYATNTPIAKAFTINKKSITPTISDIDDVTYDGVEKEPTLVVKDGSKELVLGTDYDVTYSNNINAGTATASISNLTTGNYIFDDTLSNCQKDFEIKPYELTKDNISLDSNFVKYDGTEKEPVVTVTYNGMTLTKDIDYTVTYANNIDITTEAEVLVTAISSNYSGTASVNFEISDKDQLIIYTSDNQSITYTGNEVILDDVTVSDNTDYITSGDLTIKYYDEDDNEINRPTNVGKYYVIYSFDGTNYKGSKKVDFEITKADSINPSEMTEDIKANVGSKLSSISITSEGLTWDDQNTEVIAGLNNYKATYTQNNDSNNYNTIEVYIPIYGKSIIDINTSVDGTGGTISSSVTNVVEGEEVEITLTPLEGYEIENVIVDGTDVLPTNNKVTVTAGSSDIDVVVSYKPITYSMNISSIDATTDENGIIEVEHNSSTTITISPKRGYRLSSVLVDDTEKVDEVTDNQITISDVTEDTDISIQAEKISYEVIDGARQEYIINKHTSAIFEINAEYDLFADGGKVYVDDKLVNSSNYTSKEGSTIITFNKDYMDSLDLGPHTLRVEFTDGGDASCIFRVAILKYEDGKKNDNSGNSLINPVTGDNLMTFIIISIISFIGLIFVIIKKKKMS